VVVWIIGLSGAGKSTLAEEVVAQVRRESTNIVLIDGDNVRAMFGNDLGYSIDDRKKNADRICRMCQFLDEQGINVVCAILSLFPESRSWNRENIKNYYEVFIDTPLEELRKRDPKGLYKRFEKGELHNIAGMDIEFTRPMNADLVINNVNSREDLLKNADAIVHKLVGNSR